MKRTFEKDLRGKYLLNTMEEMIMNGDAYVSSDQLCRFSRRNHKALTYDQFRSDRAFLLKEGFLHLEGTRLYQKNIWEYETAAAKALAEILAHNRPLAKLGKAIKVADARNQRKAKSKTVSAIAVAFREDTKPFEKADSVFNKDTFL